jgi:hypothetical protein
VTREGVVAPGVLLAAHRARLAGGSFTTERFARRTDPNGTVLSRVRTVARFGEDRYLVERRIDGTSTERLGTATVVEQYADRERGVRRRRVGGGNATYARVGATSGVGPEPTALLADPMAGRRIVLAFSAVNASVVARERGPDPRYVLAGEGVRSREALRSLTGRSDVSGVEDVSVRATVTADGLVERLEVRYTVSTRGSGERVLRRASFGGVGGTTVERPDWYEVAVERVGSVGGGRSESERESVRTRVNARAGVPRPVVG